VTDGTGDRVARHGTKKGLGMRISEDRTVGNRFARAVGIAATAFCVLCGNINDASAVEGATNFYLLGSRAHYAGVMPGPGSYFANDLYIYNGTATAALPLGGQVAADVDATAIIDLMTGLHVLPVQFLGGTIAVGLTVPVGWQEISASLGGPGVKDDDFEFGDPVLVGALGWHDGNFHWQIGGLLNVPIGSWNDGDLVNLGFNRWAFDLTGAVTYLDLAAGIELSSAVGITFNGENLDTGYDSGTELHAEFAASKLFANGMSLGVVGYHYQQLSGDSGGTAAQQVLVGQTDGFKGRATAIGPSFGMTVPLGDRALNMNLRWYHELDVKNRLEGDAVLFSASVPLQADPMMAAAK